VTIISYSKSLLF